MSFGLGLRRGKEIVPKNSESDRFGEVLVEWAMFVLALVEWATMAEEPAEYNSAGIGLTGDSVEV